MDLGDGKVRPVRLLNAAVTNDPNLKGLVPLSNAARSAEKLGAGRVDPDYRDFFIIAYSNGDNYHLPECE